MVIFGLSKAGYGSIMELNQLDSSELFDIMEYEQISRDIEKHLMDKA